jgi:hypothetical protein
LASSRSLVLRSASCRAAQPPCSIACSVREGLHVPREPGYGSERSQAPIRRRRIGRAKRSGHAVSRGQDGRGERPATGHGQPRTVESTLRQRVSRTCARAAASAPLRRAPSRGGLGPTCHTPRPQRRCPQQPPPTCTAARSG